MSEEQNPVEINRDTVARLAAVKLKLMAIRSISCGTAERIADEALDILRSSDLSRVAETLLSCGHPVSRVVNRGDGTPKCPTCEPGKDRVAEVPQ